MYGCLKSIEAINIDKLATNILHCIIYDNGREEASTKLVPLSGSSYNSFPLNYNLYDALCASYIVSIMYHIHYGSYESSIVSIIHLCIMYLVISGGKEVPQG